MAHAFLQRGRGGRAGKVMGAIPLLLACCTAHAGYEWKGVDGGDLSASANWTETSSDGYWYKGDDARLTLSADWTLPASFHVNRDDLALTFDIGKDRTLTFGDAYYCDADGTTVTLVSGTYTCQQGNELCLLSAENWGAKKQRNVFRITGKDTFFKANAIFSRNSRGGVFEMDEGARYEGRFRFGNRNPSDQTVNVLGGAAMSVLEGYEFFGQDRTVTTVSNATLSCEVCLSQNLSLTAPSDCALRILDGGLVRIGTDGRGAFILDGIRSCVLVDGAASRLEAGQVGIGRGGMGGETCVVTNGALMRADARGLYLGGWANKNGTDVPDSTSVSNFLHVTDRAAVLCGGGTVGDRALSVGDYGNAGAGFSRVLVDNGGALTNATWYDVKIGDCSSRNALDVRGGAFSGVGPVILGDKAESTGNRLSVTDGARFVENGSYVRVGGAGSSNLCEIADATFIHGNGQVFSVGFTNGAGNVLRVLPNGRLLGRDGALQELQGVLKLGVTTSRDNAVEILGGEIEMQRFVAGEGGSSGNALVISNGALRVQQFAFADGNTRNALVVKGTNALCEVAGAGQRAQVKGAAEVTFDLADGFYAQAPLRGAGSAFWAFDDGVGVRFAHVEGLREVGGRCELVRNDERAVAVSAQALEGWRAGLPRGARLALSADGRVLSLHVARVGMTVLVR